MFKGINEEYKKGFEQLNSGQYFYFFFADLELVEKNDNRRKCRLLSDELSQKLHSIYSASQTGHVPPLKFIDFDLDTYSHFSSLFPNDCYSYYGGWFDGHLSNYIWLLKIKKTSIQNSKVLADGTLQINSKVEITCTAAAPLYGIIYSLDEENKFTRNKGHESYSAYKSALQDIENTIQNGNIDLTTLADSGFFLNESYMSGMPRDCLACGDIDPNETPVAKYYETHLKKCIWRPDRINDFKDQQVALIKRIITQFNDYKKEAIEEVIQEVQEQGISETELNTIRPNWQNTLYSLTNREKIAEYFANYLEKDIEKLVNAKNNSGQERQQAENEAQENAKNEEERLKKEREEREKKEAEERKQKEKKAAEEKAKAAKEQAKQQELRQKREKVMAETTAVLHQEPQLTNSELSPEYQNWEQQLNQITDIQQITNFQDRLLADIQAHRKDKKTKQAVKENLNQLQNPVATSQQKEEALNNLEKNEGERAYEKQKENINQAKTEQATQNPAKYSQDAVNKIEQKMQEEGISEADLNNGDNKIKVLLTSLKNGEIKNPTKIVEAENEIRQKIWQTKVEKEIQTLNSEVNQVLQTGNIKKENVTKIKQKLIEFLAKSNVYYTSQHQKVQALLTKLESYSNANQQNNNISNPSSVPWKIIIPLFLAGILLLMGAMVWRVKMITRKRKSK